MKDRQTVGTINDMQHVVYVPNVDRSAAVNSRDLPVINVTPQSPNASEEWNILDGSISQIQGIQESIQKMREMQAAGGMDHGMKNTRFCSSCPSLSSAKQIFSPDVLRESKGDGILSNMYMEAMPESVSGEIDQRGGWTEDQAKSKIPERSVSLSSAESDSEDAFLKAAGGQGRLKDYPDKRSEMPDFSLQYGDVPDGFFRMRESKGGPEVVARKAHRSISLQKSVSTPSILGNVDEATSIATRQRLSQHFSGSDSEEDVGVLCGTPSANYAGYDRGVISIIATKDPPHLVTYRDMLRDASSQEEDTAAAGKRRKRSSIFFKKKKQDKDRSRRGPAVSGPSPVLIGSSASFNLSSTSSSGQGFGAKSLTLPANTKSGTQFYPQPIGRYSMNSSSALQRKPNGNSPTGTNAKDFGRMANDREYGGDDYSPGYGDNPGDYLTMDLREGNNVESEIMRDFPSLKLLNEEPEAWSKCVDKKISKSITEVEVKRQEHIYEFMITEKHHCVTLQLMEKLFSGDMSRKLQYGHEFIRQVFPCLEELINWHSNFLRRLRERQEESSIVPTISDILVEQFSGDCGAQLEKAYGIFCSQHKDADLVRVWSEHVLCKKKGIPECILFVTQRITKYPLLIDPLIKTSRTNPVECEALNNAMDLVKRILVNVNGKVAEKERATRLLEVYNKIDAKSSTTLLSKKFKKADLLHGNRKLRFEGVASMVLTPRGKSVELTVIVFSDIVIFLQENNQKYFFFTNEKVCVLPVSKLLVREKAGTGDNNALYLISNPADPEMYELICVQPKDRKVWIESIREVIANCTSGEEEEFDEGTKMRDARLDRIKQITVLLQQHDLNLAKLCEEKINLQFELLEVCGHEDVPSPPSFQKCPTDLDIFALRDRLRQTVQEASKIASNLCTNGATNLSRSASSVGEHYSNAYVSPILPRRAETFGGFDNSVKDPTGVNRKKASPVPPELIEVSEASSPMSERHPSLYVRAFAPHLSIIGRTRSQGRIDVGPSATTLSQGSLTRPSSPLPKVALALGLALGGPSPASSPAISPMRSPGGGLCWNCHRVLSRSPSNLALQQLSPVARSPEPSLSPRRASSPVPGLRRTLMSFLVDRPRRTTLPAVQPGESLLNLPGSQYPVGWGGTSSPSSHMPTALGLPISSIVPGSKEQQMAVAQLSGYLSTIWYLVEHQCTNLESMKAELTTAYDKITRLTGEDPRGSNSSAGGKGNKGLLSHNQRLEELRNLQDRFSREREAWEKDRKMKEEELNSKEKELKEVQERLKKDKEDVVHQRDQLYTKVQTLKNQGIILDTNFHIVSMNLSDDNSPMRPNCSVIEINKGSSGQSSTVSSPQPQSPPLSASASAADFRKKLAETQRSKSVTSVSSAKAAQAALVHQQLPQHLISATNQQKVSQKAQNVQIKQQLPLKLAKLAEKTSGGSERSSPGSSPSGSLQSPLNMSQEHEKVHQILPMKLSEDKSGKASFGYQKFGATTPSVPPRTGIPQTFHSRSGSSPADIPPEQIQAAGRQSNVDQPVASGLYKSNSSGSRYASRPFAPVRHPQQEQYLQQPQPLLQHQQQRLTVTRSDPRQENSPRPTVDPDTNEEIIYF